MLYCFGLDYLPTSLVVTLSNLNIVITVVLGIVLLQEPATALKIAGLICIMAAVLVLARVPARHAASPEASSASSASTPAASPRVCDHGLLHCHDRGSAFLEKPALKGPTAIQLNVLMGMTMTAVAGIALAMWSVSTLRGSSRDGSCSRLTVPGARRYRLRAECSIGFDRGDAHRPRRLLHDA
jgi:drug/metabolite transporter (DMT)-like permease